MCTHARHMVTPSMGVMAVLVALLAASAAQQQYGAPQAAGDGREVHVTHTHHRVSNVFVHHMDAYFQGRRVEDYNPFAPMDCDGAIKLGVGAPGRLLHRRGPSPWTEPGTWVASTKAYHVDDYLHYFEKASARLTLCQCKQCKLPRPVGFGHGLACELSQASPSLNITRKCSLECDDRSTLSHVQPQHI